MNNTKASFKSLPCTAYLTNANTWGALRPEHGPSAFCSVVWCRCSGAREGSSAELLRATPHIFRVPVLFSICSQMCLSSRTFGSLFILPWVVTYSHLSRHRCTLKYFLKYFYFLVNKPEPNGLLLFFLSIFGLLFKFSFFSGNTDECQTTTQTISGLSWLLQSSRRRGSKLINRVIDMHYLLVYQGAKDSLRGPRGQRAVFS